MRNIEGLELKVLTGKNVVPKGLVLSDLGYDVGSDPKVTFSIMDLEKASLTDHEFSFEVGGFRFTDPETNEEISLPIKAYPLENGEFSLAEMFTLALTELNKRFGKDYFVPEGTQLQIELTPLPDDSGVKMDLVADRSLFSPVYSLGEETFSHDFTVFSSLWLSANKDQPDAYPLTHLPKTPDPETSLPVTAEGYRILPLVIKEFVADAESVTILPAGRLRNGKVHLGDIVSKWKSTIEMYQSMGVLYGWYDSYWFKFDVDEDLKVIKPSVKRDVKPEDKLEGVENNG